MQQVAPVLPMYRNLKTVGDFSKLKQISKVRQNFNFPDFFEGSLCVSRKVKGNTVKSPLCHKARIFYDRYSW